MTNKGGHYVILNIKVDECWRCKNDFLVAYIDNGESIPYGPSSFSEEQKKLAIAKGVLIETVFSKTMNTAYESCVCPHCKSFLGDFFYHDYTYVPGEIEIVLDENDKVKEVIKHEELTLRPFNGFDIEEDNKRIFQERADKKNVEKKWRAHEKSEYNCVRVKFENGKNYLYNCPFEAKIGDYVYVEGKLQGVKGRIVKVEGKWRLNKNMQEVIKIDSKI